MLFLLFIDDFSRKILKPFPGSGGQRWLNEPSLSDLRYKKRIQDGKSIKRLNNTISWRRTLPSFVILISPDPDTNLKSENIITNYSILFVFYPHFWKSMQKNKDFHLKLGKFIKAWKGIKIFVLINSQLTFFENSDEIKGTVDLLDLNRRIRST